MCANLAGVQIPELKEFLKAGVQFGHETKRWNPKMKNYIYSSKGNIHILDVTQTLPLLEKALEAIIEAARKGSILFVGTKRQASHILREEAIRAGAYFVDHRWAGGLLSNFSTINQSLKKLNELERGFEEGVSGRTKYEISRMKVEWSRLSRLYGGIKNMKNLPQAVVVIDPRYEIGAVVEAKKLGIPVIAVMDTNCDPDMVDYVIPANDDAIKSIKLFMKLFADSVLAGNGGQGVTHKFKDYSKVEVKIIKKDTNIIEEPLEDKEFDTSEKSKVVRVKKEKPQEDKSKKIRIKKPAEKKNNVKVDKTEISSRILASLEKANITLEKAKSMTKEELVAIKGIGEKAAEEILN